MGQTPDAVKTKGFFLFNLIFSGAVAGFGLALFIISCSTGVPAKSSVLAEERSSQASSGVFALQDSFRSVTKATLPSVVSVKVKQKVEIQSRSNPFGEEFPWEFFFGPQQNRPNPQSPKRNSPQNPQVPQQTPAPQERIEEGLGSGFVVRREGNTVYVLTNYHVAGEADDILLLFKDDREFKAKLVGGDPRKDLALVSFETGDKDIQPITLGNSDELEVGDIVLAMGNPLGFEFSVTQGIVSALGRQSGPDGNISSFIQTDASINRGNSGGPLLNLKGEVIGINTWIASPDGASVGLGFSVPINNAKKAISDFISQGKVSYGWLGVSIGNLDRELAKEMGLENQKGAFVFHLFRNSPADKGGINPGDFITSLNGSPVRDYNDLTQRVGDLPAGQAAEFELIRNGKKMSLKVAIEERQRETEISSQSNLLWPGLTVTPLTEEIRKSIKVGTQVQGLVIANIVEGGASEIAGLRQGDVLTQINGQNIRTLGDFYRQISQTRGELKLSFHRQGVDLSIGIIR